MVVYQQSNNQVNHQSQWVHKLRQLSNNPIFKALEQYVIEQDYKIITRATEPDKVFAQHNFISGRKSIFDYVNNAARIATEMDNAKQFMDSDM